MCKVVTLAVEEHVTEASADDDAAGDSRHDGDDVVGRDLKVPASGDAVDHHSGGKEAKQVRKAIPADRKRPHRQGDGVNAVVQVVEPHEAYQAMAG